MAYLEIMVFTLMCFHASAGDAPRLDPSEHPVCCPKDSESSCKEPSPTSISELLDEQRKEFEETSVKDTSNMKELYDFIIVGGGMAGSIVANRLTENPEWEVLLVEAGGEQPFHADVPAKASSLENTDLDWIYKIESQKHACLTVPCLVPAGKALGGSSVINYMFYVQGNEMDYEKWASLGNPGWNYTDVQKYFSKSLEHVDEETPSTSGTGYQPVETFPYTDVNAIAILKAFEELGVPIRENNRQSQIGGILAESTGYKGERYSTSKSFLNPIKSRPNLHVSLHSFVTKILINEEDKQSYGVEFDKDETNHKVLARKEIILSAGTIRSPQLLMLSGIGPKEHLEEHDIPVISNLSVGDNLHDHVTSLALSYSLNTTASYPVPEDQSVCDNYTYYLNRKGPLASIGASQAMVFSRSKNSDSQQEFADTAFVFLPAVKNLPPEHLCYYEQIIVLPVYFFVKSRGTVRLGSTKPHDQPLIDPNYLKESHDNEKLVEAMEKALQLKDTEAFKNIGAHVQDTPLPGCTEHTFGTSDYFNCAIQHYTSGFKHPVGTCKMGPPSDKDAVVDSELKVHGIRNLRVIDASIMPSIISGFSIAPTMMIAEKGSDLLKAQWSK